MAPALVRSTAVLAVGTAVGQLAVLIAIPFLARIYSPGEFGALAILTTVSNIAFAVACLRFDQALVSAPDGDVPSLILACLTGCLITATIAGGVVWMLGLGAGLGLASWMAAVLIGCTALLAGLSQAFAAWSLRRGAVHHSAIVRASQGTAFVGLALISSFGMLWAHALSFLAGLMLVRAPREKWNVAWTVIRAQWRFPLMSLPGAALDVVGYSCVIWVIVSFYGETEAGHYSQIQRLVGAPLMLAAISLGQVLLRRSAMLLESEGKPAVQKELHRAFAVMIGGGVLALVLLALAGQQVFGWLLGPEWRTDGSFLLMIGIAVTVRACVSPLSTALIALRRFDLTLMWQGAYFLSATIVFVLVAQRAEFDQFVLFYCCHECVFYAIYLLLIRYAVRH